MLADPDGSVWAALDLGHFGAKLWRRDRDGVWREKGILDKFPSGGPKVKWRAEVGAGYSGPAVAGGKVFLKIGRAHV